MRFIKHKKVFHISHIPIGSILLWVLALYPSIHIGAVQPSVRAYKLHYIFLFATINLLFNYPILPVKRLAFAIQNLTST